MGRGPCNFYTREGFTSHLSKVVTRCVDVDDIKFPMGIENENKIIEKIKEVFPESEGNKYYRYCKIPYRDKDLNLKYTVPDLILVTNDNKVYIFELKHSLSKTIKFDDQIWMTEYDEEPILSPIKQNRFQCSWINSRYYFVHEEKFNWIQGIVIIIARHRSLLKIGEDNYSNNLSTDEERGIIITPDYQTIPEKLKELLSKLTKSREIDPSKRDRFINFLEAHTDYTLVEKEKINLHTISEQLTNSLNHEHTDTHNNQHNSTRILDQMIDDYNKEKEIFFYRWKTMVITSLNDISYLTEKTLDFVRDKISAFWKKGLVLLIICFILLLFVNYEEALSSWFVEIKTAALDKIGSESYAKASDEKDFKEIEKPVEVEEYELIVALSRSTLQRGKDIALMNREMMKELNIQEGTLLTITAHNGNSIILPVFKDTGHLHKDHIRLDYNDRKSLGVQENSKGYDSYTLDKFMISHLNTRFTLNVKIVNL
jgi:hypothetical protein